MVVIKPDSMPMASSKGLTKGAKQLVVQLAFDTTTSHGKELRERVDYKPLNQAHNQIQSGKKEG